MATITPEALKAVLEAHRKWVGDEEGGVRANLSGANLSYAGLRGANLSYAGLRGANLSGANLRGADLSSAYLSSADLSGAELSGADLRGANLSGADLSGADLRGANLSGADLSGADLRGANLRAADLRGANLRGAYLRSAYLSGAYLSGADLSGAEHDDKTQWPAFQVCPQVGGFVAWKRLQNGVVAELLIPAAARRSSSVVGRKCRAEFAEVLSLTQGSDPVDEGFSTRDAPEEKRLRYTVGATMRPDSFEDDFTKECGHGIHFYLTKQEAIDHM